jgi:phosphate transport system permease protein
MNIKLKRKIINNTALLLSLAAMAFGLFWLIWILWSVFERGVSSLSLSLLRSPSWPVFT